MSTMYASNPETTQGHQQDEIVGNTDVLVDAEMSVAKLLRLIKLGREEERLDYKGDFDSSKNPKDKVELARDVVAMANTFGGYLVFGVDEVTDGNSRRYDPKGLLPESYAKLDSAKMREVI